MTNQFHYYQSANHVNRIAADLKMGAETRVRAQRVFEQFQYLANQSPQDEASQDTLLKQIDALIEVAR